MGEDGGGFVAPGHEAIAGQAGRGEIQSCHHRHHRPQAGGRGGLTQGVIAPADQGAIAAHCDRVIAPGDNKLHFGNRTGNVELAQIVGTPTEDPAVPRQGDRMPCAGCDANDVAQAIRWTGLAALVVTPANDPAVPAQGKVVKIPGRDGDDIG